MTFVDTELSSHGSPDWEDNAVEHGEDEAPEALGVAAQHELRILDAELQRIAAGEYGSCARCGAKIDARRLDLLPATPFCKACAQ